MATNIQFSASADGSSPYTLAVNPNSMELNDSTDQRPYPVIDDAPVWQKNAFDGRTRTLVWTSPWRVDNTTMSTQLTTLRGYIGLVRYCKWNDANYLAAETGWVKHRVVDVHTTLRAGGRLKFEQIEMLLQKEP